MSKTLEVHKSEDGKSVTIMCEDEFVTWDAESFLRHMKWIPQAIEAEKQLQAEQQAHNELKEKLKIINDMYEGLDSAQLRGIL